MGVSEWDVDFKKVDVYALGKSLQEMYTMVSSPSSSMYKNELVQLMSGMTASDPNDRYSLERASRILESLGARPSYTRRRPLPPGRHQRRNGRYHSRGYNQPSYHRYY